MKISDIERFGGGMNGPVGIREVTAQFSRAWVLLTFLGPRKGKRSLASGGKEDRTGKRRRAA